MHIRVLPQLTGAFAVGWISTLRVLGDTLNIEGFYAVHLVMAVIMCTVWLVLFVLTMMAFWKGKIFLAKSEDVIQDEIEKKAMTKEMV